MLTAIRVGTSPGMDLNDLPGTDQGFPRGADVRVVGIVRVVVVDGLPQPLRAPGACVEAHRAEPCLHLGDTPDVRLASWQALAEAREVPFALVALNAHPKWGRLECRCQLWLGLHEDDLAPRHPADLEATWLRRLLLCFLRLCMLLLQRIGMLVLFLLLRVLLLLLQLLVVWHQVLLRILLLVELLVLLVLWLPLLLSNLLLLWSLLQRLLLLLPPLLPLLLLLCLLL